MFKFLKGFGGNAGATETPYLIDLRNVKKAYKTEAGDFLALKNVNLTIDRGEFVAIIGKSGSGKSTLVNMMTGIDRPTSGEVFINGTGIHKFDEGQMARWRGKNIGVVFQFFQLLPTLTVLENIVMPMDLCGLYTPSQRKERAMYLLKLVDVEKQAKKLPSQLSGGQQQRVAIARALANDPPIIMADEPTGNLDSKTANQVFELFTGLVNNEGKTLLMVTHDDSLKERVSRRVTIADGEIIDEWLLKALPGLSQEQQAQASNNAQRYKFRQGEPIFEGEHHANDFYIVTRGEVVLERYREREVLKPGQFFGAEDVINGDERQYTAWASPESGAEVLTLPQQMVMNLLHSSEETRHAVLFALRERHAAVA
jgi:ABC-type lipoprotein export system ATPase subunit